MRTISSIVCVGTLLLHTGIGGAMAQAKAAELTDKSVATLMNFAWGMVPEKFTQPDGKTIAVDKAKRDASMVPVDVAREVIKVAYRSAKAQQCKLTDQVVVNQRTLMKRELDKKQWSDQQMLFMNTLHLFVVMLKTGNVQITEQDGENEVKVSQNDGATPVAATDPAAEAAAGKAAAEKAPDCTEEQKKAITDEITAYVKG